MVETNREVSRDVKNKIPMWETANSSCPVRKSGMNGVAPEGPFGDFVVGVAEGSKRKNFFN